MRTYQGYERAWFRAVTKQCDRGSSIKLGIRRRFTHTQYNKYVGTVN